MKLLFFTIGLFLYTSSAGQRNGIVPVKKIPSVALYNLDVDSTNLLNLSSGKVTFVDFWFVPCGPCFAEMHLLHSIYNEFRQDLNFRLITITFSDSAFVRPLIENRNADLNETYTYFKTLSKLDTFSLPVYFMYNVTQKNRTFVKSSNGFTGKTEKFVGDKSAYPSSVFGFSAYPTILIFDKKGNLVYNKTGFLQSGEMQQRKIIQSIIRKNL